MDLERRIERLVERLEPIVERHPFISRWLWLFTFGGTLESGKLLVDLTDDRPWRFSGPLCLLYVSVAFVAAAWAYLLQPLQNPDEAATPRAVLGIIGPAYLKRWLIGSALFVLAGSAFTWASYGSPTDHDALVLALLAPALVGAVYALKLGLRLRLAWLRQLRLRRGRS
jgi:hypothetical protein